MMLAYVCNRTLYKWHIDVLGSTLILEERDDG